VDQGTGDEIRSESTAAEAVGRESGSTEQ
jgi:hypothetical protein